MSASLKDLSPIDRNQIANLISQVSKLQADISLLKRQQEEADQLIETLEDMNQSLRQENERLHNRHNTPKEFTKYRSISPIEAHRASVDSKKELVKKIKRLQAAKLKTWRDANNIVRGKLVYFEEEEDSDDFMEENIPRSVQSQFEFATRNTEFSKHDPRESEEQLVHEASLLADLLNKQDANYFLSFLGRGGAIEPT